MNGQGMLVKRVFQLEIKRNGKKCQVINVADAFSICHKKHQHFCFLFLLKESKAVTSTRGYVASQQNLLWYKWTSMKTIPVNSTGMCIPHTRTKSTCYFLTMRLKSSKSKENHKKITRLNFHNFMFLLAKN